MSRILGWHVSIEMVGLWLIEAVSCFVLLLVVPIQLANKFTQSPPNQLKLPLPSSPPLVCRLR